MLKALKRVWKPLLGLVGSMALVLSVAAVPSAAAGPSVQLVGVPLTRVGQVGAGSSSVAAPSPDNTVTGDCGTAYMSVGDAGSGYAVITLGAISSQGAIIYESNSWTAVTSAGTTLSGGDASAPFSSDWEESYREHTGPGFVSAAGSIYVITENGSVCTSAPLAASAYIT